MQLKLKLGSPNDIPIDEVLIYISNIPLDPSSQVMAELAVMEQVREEAPRRAQPRPSGGTPGTPSENRATQAGGRVGRGERCRDPRGFL